MQVPDPLPGQLVLVQIEQLGMSQNVFQVVANGTSSARDVVLGGGI